MKRGGPIKRTTPLKAKRRKTTPTRQSARGKDCQIRIPGYCESTNETVVLCHYRMKNDGGSLKPDDSRAAYGCRTCHDIVDGRMEIPEEDFSYVEIRLMHAEGVFRTQEILAMEGLL